MSREEQRTADRIMREHGNTIGIQAAEQAAKLRAQQAKGTKSAKVYGIRASRLENLAAATPPKGVKLTRKKAAQNRVEAVKVAAFKRLP